MIFSGNVRPKKSRMPVQATIRRLFLTWALHQHQLADTHDFSALRSSMSGFPADTTSFGLTNNFSTVAPFMLCSALTGISSFIASRIDTICSMSILSPSWTSIFQTLAFNGASMGMMFGSGVDRNFVSFVLLTDLETRQLR